MVKAIDCKSIGITVVGSNPTYSNYKINTNLLKKTPYNFYKNTFKNFKLILFNNNLNKNLKQHLNFIFNFYNLKLKILNYIFFKKNLNFLIFLFLNKKKFKTFFYLDTFLEKKYNKFKFLNFFLNNNLNLKNIYIYNSLKNNSNKLHFLYKNFEYIYILTKNKYILNKLSSSNLNSKFIPFYMPNFNLNFFFFYVPFFFNLKFTVNMFIYMYILFI